MVVNERPLKRAKRRVTADLCDFLTFPDDGAGLDGPFRANIRAFLARHGRPAAPPPPPPAILPHPSAADGDGPRLLTWRVAFRVGGGCAGYCDGQAAEVALDVVEEDVPRSKSIYCDQCRVVGWSDHPVCGKRYHFIIRNDKNSMSTSGVTCTRCGTLLSLSNLRCYSCNCEMTTDDTFEDRAYLQLEDSTNLLHGIVHANGFGHLLRVNGREGGSKYLTGCDIMSFWDRLCQMLRVRKVSVMDISKKHGMDYRLLHAVIAGHPWYGNWGYKFGAGSFALTAESYHKAVDTLSKVPLSIFFSRGGYPRTPLQNTIDLYRSLSDQQPVTVRDLFRCVLHQLHEAPERAKSESPAGKKPVAGVLCALTRDGLQPAEELIVKVLRAVGGSRWVTWRALRGAACYAIEPRELLDCCLRGVVGKTVGDGMVVTARYNAETKAIEYRLEAADNQQSSAQCLPRPSADHLIHDLKFLYDALLNPASMQPYKPSALRESALSSAVKLLDCKQFIRHYDESVSYLSPPNPSSATALWCHVKLVDHPEDYTAPPPELLILSAGATIADLKLQVTKTFQETYLVFQRFQAEQLLDHEEASDVTPVKSLFGSYGVARLRGRFLGIDQSLGLFRKERGVDNWIVDCVCGAKDDDGERMMACDACGVWQHTRCAGVDDFEEVPAKFVCKKCVGIRKYRGRGVGRPKNDRPNGRCKDEIGPSLTSVGRLTTVG
ncbi:PHD finger protein At1g33420-like [Musa acuminata AAA Group]|uniref:PHD finger protein At1g33420-like n=1 Tax=Musa acuminata AAA Group TaxID=214697 RepID=UPI0031D757AB